MQVRRFGETFLMIAKATYGPSAAFSMKLWRLCRPFAQKTWMACIKKLRKVSSTTRLRTTAPSWSNSLPVWSRLIPRTVPRATRSFVLRRLTQKWSNLRWFDWTGTLCAKNEGLVCFQLSNYLKIWKIWISAFRKLSTKTLTVFNCPTRRETSLPPPRQRIPALKW